MHSQAAATTAPVPQREPNVGVRVSDSQRRDFTQQMNRTTGSYELVISPLILALIGYGIDRWLGTVPIFTIVLGVLGLAGACIKLYYGYTSEMEEHEAEGPWAKRS